MVDLRRLKVKPDARCVGGQPHDPAALYPGKRPGDRVGPGPF